MEESRLIEVDFLFRPIPKPEEVDWKRRGSKSCWGLAVVWIASPIDLIPEFISIAGP
jgi:hypothetical protein